MRATQSHQSPHVPPNAVPPCDGAACVALDRLTADYRLEVRRLALEAVDIAASRGAQVVDIDLGAVHAIDASGLGVLMLAQTRARERGMRLRLTAVPCIVGALLNSMRLAPLFDVVHAP